MTSLSSRCRTKIIATLGPACDQETEMARLISGGVDLFRLNFSHGELADKQAQINRLRRLAREMGQVIGLLADLQGPKIRIGDLPQGGLTLISGQTISLTLESPCGERSIPISDRFLITDIQIGQHILIDDGQIELLVEGKTNSSLKCQILMGGHLTSRKGLNLPDSQLAIPALTRKDEQDLDFILTEDFDFVALSFVHKGADIEQLRRRIDERNSAIKIIAKIEKPEAVEAFTEILAAADGIMVARGDLGVEMKLEKVPLIQKNIIRACVAAGKPVITATQMLESMISKPVPTRAETSDAANAILDGSDALMLSGETAIGEFPWEAVRVLTRIAGEVERDLYANRNCAALNLENLTGKGNRAIDEAIAQAACRTALTVRAELIVAFTQTGSTARLLAKNRPLVPVLALTPSVRVQQQLTLLHGVRSLAIDMQADTESLIRAAEETILAHNLLQPGAIIVITLGSPVSDPGATNLIKVQRLSR